MVAPHVQHSRAVRAVVRAQEGVDPDHIEVGFCIFRIESVGPSRCGLRVVLASEDERSDVCKWRKVFEGAFHSHIEFLVLEIDEIKASWE